MTNLTTIKFVSNNTDLLWLFAFIILEIGFGFGFNGLDTAFPRSGALLVVFALVVAYFNHIVIASKAFYDNFQAWSDAPDIVQQPFIKTYLGSNKINLLSNDEKSKQIREQVIALNKIVIILLKEIQKKLAKIELTSGLLGTLVWGFGDLVV